MPAKKLPGSANNGNRGSLPAGQSTEANIAKFESRSEGSSNVLVIRQNIALPRKHLQEFKPEVDRLSRLGHIHIARLAFLDAEKQPPRNPKTDWTSRDPLTLAAFLEDLNQNLTSPDPKILADNGKINTSLRFEQKHLKAPFDYLSSRFLCIARAVEYLHMNKIQHKRLMPANILVGEGDQSDQLWVTGFSSLSEADATTSTGDGLCGISRYLAPEFTPKSKKKVDLSADIFSLGAIFLEMLALCSGMSLERQEKDIRKSSDRSFGQNTDNIREWFGAWYEFELGAQCLHLATEVKLMLHERPNSRPDATQVVHNLQLLLWPCKDCCGLSSITKMAAISEPLQVILNYGQFHEGHCKEVIEQKTKDNNSKDNGSKDNSSKDNGSKDNSSKDNSSKDNSSKDNSSKDNSSKDNSSKDNSSKDNSSKDNSSKDKSSKDKQLEVEYVKIDDDKTKEATEGEQLDCGKTGGEEVNGKKPDAKEAEAGETEGQRVQTVLSGKKASGTVRDGKVWRCRYYVEFDDNLVQIARTRWFLHPSFLDPQRLRSERPFETIIDYEKTFTVKIVVFLKYPVYWRLTDKNGQNANGYSPWSQPIMIEKTLVEGKPTNFTLGLDIIQGPSLVC